MKTALASCETDGDPGNVRGVSQNISLSLARTVRALLLKRNLTCVFLLSWVIHPHHVLREGTVPYTWS